MSKKLITWVCGDCNTIEPEIKTDDGGELQYCGGCGSMHLLGFNSYAQALEYSKEAQE